MAPNNTAPRTTHAEVFDMLETIETTLDKCQRIARLETVEFASIDDATAFYAKYFPSVRLNWTRRFNRMADRFQNVARDGGPLNLVTCCVYE